MAQFTIQANAKGTLLPFIVAPRQRLVIQYLGGFWTANRWIPPTPYDANGNPHLKADGNCLYPGFNSGSLIALVGNPSQAKWNVGNYNIINGEGNFAGQVWVAINDGWNTTPDSYSDNLGSIIIDVKFYTPQYLDELTDENEMQRFVDAHGHSIGINSIGQFKNAIIEKDDKLFNFSNPPSIEREFQAPNE